MNSRYRFALLGLAFCLACKIPYSQETAPAEEAPAPPPVPEVLDLETALAVSVAQNPSLQAAQERVKQARQRTREAASVFFPMVDTYFNASKTWLSNDMLRAQRGAVLAEQQGLLLKSLFSQPSGFGFVSGIAPLDFAREATLAGIRTYSALDVDETTEAYGLGVRATWVLFNGFEREFTRLGARHAYRESLASQADVRRLLRSAVAQTYYRAQLARELLTIAEADEAFNARLLKEAEARHRMGTGSLSDQLNFEVRKNAARSSVIAADRNYGLALIALSELMGVADRGLARDQRLSALAVESPEWMTIPEADPLIASAFESRPDLERSEYAVRRAEAGVGASRAPFYPEVIASASYDARQTDDTEFHEDNFTKSIGVTVSYELFAGGRNRARLVGAKAARAEAEWNVRSTEQSVSAEVRQAVEEVRAAQQTLIVERANADLVRRTRDLVEKEYDAGQGSLVRLNEAQRDLTRADASLVQAQVNLANAWFQVRTATGDTEPDGAAPAEAGE